MAAARTSRHARSLRSHPDRDREPRGARPCAFSRGSRLTPDEPSPSPRSRLSKHPPQPSLVRADGLVVPQAAVREADDVMPSVSSKSISISVCLVSPSHSQVNARCRGGRSPYSSTHRPLGPGVRIAHHRAHGTADAQIDDGHGGLPVMPGVPPAPHHLLAGPGVGKPPVRAPGTCARYAASGSTPFLTTRIRRAASTTDTAGSAGSPPGSPPLPPAVRAP